MSREMLYKWNIRLLEFIFSPKYCFIWLYSPMVLSFIISNKFENTTFKLVNSISDKNCDILSYFIYHWSDVAY